MMPHFLFTIDNREKIAGVLVCLAIFLLFSGAPGGQETYKAVPVAEDPEVEKEC